MKTNFTNYIEFQTDMKMNAQKLETHGHSSTFSIVCGKLQHASESIMKAVRIERIQNINDEDLSVLNSLKSNKDIVVCKMDKGNCTVLLDKIDYIKKANEILRKHQ